MHVAARELAQDLDPFGLEQRVGLLDLLDVERVQHLQLSCTSKLIHHHGLRKLERWRLRPAHPRRARRRGPVVSTSRWRGASRSWGSPASASSRTTPPRRSARRAVNPEPRRPRPRDHHAQRRHRGAQPAVEIAAREGARIVSVPRPSARSTRPGRRTAIRASCRCGRSGASCAIGRVPPVPVVDDAGELLPEAHLDVLAVDRPPSARARPATLARRDSRWSTRRSRAACATSWSPTPSSRRRTSPISDQVALADRGALLERCFTTPHTGKVSWERVLAAAAPRSPSAPCVDRPRAACTRRWRTGSR